MIDLRSDTVTQPTPAMRQAMADAPVGDDVFAEDPTVIELERATADFLGKDAAIFVPSGTMANQLAVRLHTHPGDEVLLDQGAHIFNYESGGAAVLSGVTICPIPGPRGIFTADDVRSRLRPPDVHHAPATLVCVENTNNVGGGSIWPIATLASVSKAARGNGLKLHMDGARLWNASVASGIPERAFADLCDSVAVCFSKGLGAPVGSALAGPAEFIARARRFRKMLGGGMRQAGIIAAGALYALRHHRSRLADDHANARVLAEALAAHPSVQIDLAAVETNIVRFSTPGIDAKHAAADLRERGVSIMVTGPHAFRSVLHLQVSAADTRKALDLIRGTLDCHQNIR